MSQAPIEVEPIAPPQRVGAILSMLHEPAVHSAKRLFRGEPVLAWTLRRLAMSERLAAAVVICWDDQVGAVRRVMLTPGAGRLAVEVLAKPRQRLANVDAVSAARRWADGWRGGLLQSCHFDAGFHGPWVKEALEQLKCDSALLVEPSSALVDAALIDGLIGHAAEHRSVELCFLPAAPGFGAALLDRCLVDRLAESQAHPGRLLCYNPDQAVRDPLGGEGCAPVPATVARTTGQYRLDSDRQVRRLTEALESLNGTAASAAAEGIVARTSGVGSVERLPREVVVELTTVRATKPIYQPGTHLRIDRPPMTAEVWKALLAELAGADDMRLTLAGAGDPLLHAEVFELIEAASTAGIAAVHVETDLLCDVETVRRLATAAVDVLSVHVPALTAATYQRVMGLDGLGRVLENFNQLAQARRAAGTGTPLIVPTLMKCQENLAEMEQWYDRWVAAVSGAAITGPSDFAGQIPACELAEMAPSRRRPCARLASRLTVLCDGSIVACEQDVLGLKPLGRVGHESVSEAWTTRLAPLRAGHAKGDFSGHPLCGKCREWHRP